MVVHVIPNTAKWMSTMYVEKFEEIWNTINPNTVVN